MAVVVVGDGRAIVGRRRPASRSGWSRTPPTPFGAFGLPGASPPASVTVTVIVCVAVFSRSTAPLVAVTTTTYWLLPAALAGSTLTMSLASSKFGAASNVSAPEVAPIEKNAWSAPPVIA